MLVAILKNHPTHDISYELKMMCVKRQSDPTFRLAVIDGQIDKQTNKQIYRQTDSLINFPLLPSLDPILVISKVSVWELVLYRVVSLWRPTIRSRYIDIGTVPTLIILTLVRGNFQELSLNLLFSHWSGAISGVIPKLMILILVRSNS